MFITRPRAIPFQRKKNGPWFVEARISIMGASTGYIPTYCTLEWQDRTFASRDAASTFVEVWWREAQQ